MTNTDNKIKLPVKLTVDGVTEIKQVEATLVENKQPSADDKLIKSLQYLPDFLQEKPIMKDASRLLDACLGEDEETLAQIRQAYCDTLYKLPGYSNLSYGAKISLLKEKGFDYMLNLLLHIYDDDYNAMEPEQQKQIDYNDFVEQKCDKILSNVTMLFNLLNFLKGKTIGLELAFNLVNLPAFLYMPWNVCTRYVGDWEGSAETLPMPGGDIEVTPGDTYTITENGIGTDYTYNGVNWHYCDDYKKYTEPREQFTADLNIYGTGSADLQKRIIEFVRYYMLPYIDVKLNFTASFKPVYCYPCGTFMLLNTLLLSNYYDENGNLIQHNLMHFVSDEDWTDADYFNVTQLIFGQPKQQEKAFQGEINLKQSYVQDINGVNHYFWTDEQIVPDEIQGPARLRYDDDNKIPEFYGDDDYVSAPINKGFCEVDITTGTQKNPTWDLETGEFDRDTLVKFFTCLLVRGIHHAKTIKQVGELFIEDFNKEIKETEVYAGRETIMYPVSGKVIDTVNNDTNLPTGNNRHYLEKYLVLKEKDASLVEELYNNVLDGTMTKKQALTIFFQPYIDSPFSVLVFVDCIKIFTKELVAAEKMSVQKSKDITTYLYKQHERYLNGIIKEQELFTISFDYLFSITADPMQFITTAPTIREKVGTEETIHLKFTDAFIKNDRYTGIGDIGILGSNEYFIYNGMLFYNIENDFKQLDYDTTWTDVGASHAISENYYTPAIKDGVLYFLKDESITTVIRDWNNLGAYSHGVIKHDIEAVSQATVEEWQNKMIKYFQTHYDLSFWDTYETNNWSHVTGYISDHYTAFGICNGSLYAIYYNESYNPFDLDDRRIVYTLIDEEQGWSYITGTHYINTYEAYGIKNGKLYRIQKDQIVEIKCGDQELVGWDPSIDCISRYHHSNPEYITYGICNGQLYLIQDEVCEQLDSQNTWTAICGYYDDKSPRTFAYAINNGQLYELQGRDVVLKDSTKYWMDITGCTTSTNTFVLGIGKDNINELGGSLYKISAAKNLSLLDENKDWTEVFGRYTTSTSKAANCFGYAVRENRLYVLTRTEMKNMSGMWKKDGIGLSVDLADYNIEDINLTLPDGTLIEGKHNVIDAVPIDGNDKESNYDIYVTYDTVGFEDNTRYNIRTELQGTYFTYLSPDEADRTGITLANDPNDFDSNTGLIDQFITKNFIAHGPQKMTGSGEATNFISENSYIEIMEDTANEYIIKIRYNCIEEDLQTYPVILDLDGTSGIFYGYKESSGKHGLIVKSESSSGERTKLIHEADFVNPAELYLKFTNNGTANNYDLSISEDNVTYTAAFVSEHNSDTDYNVLKAPKYLGGNGTIFGNATILLLQSSVDGVALYENGRYLSAQTLNMDIIETFITNENQEIQKVIEIEEVNGDDLVEFHMNTLYETMDAVTSNNKLEIENNYNYNTLKIGNSEGVTKSTLRFAGDYTLDPLKASAVGEIEKLSGYNKHTIASNFSNEDYININPDQIEKDPLVITTGNDVNAQYLLNTEEDSAYTNKYLLTADIEAEYKGDNTLTTVPSGEAFEIITDVPGVVKKTLTFNAEAFEINPDKIWGHNDFTYDSYTAIMSNFIQRETSESEGYDIAATVPLDLENGVISGDTVKCLPILNIKVAGLEKQKIAQFDSEDIEIGHLVQAIRTTYPLYAYKKQNVEAVYTKIQHSQGSNNAPVWPVIFDLFNEDGTVYTGSDYKVVATTDEEDVTTYSIEATRQTTLDSTYYVDEITETEIDGEDLEDNQQLVYVEEPNPVLIYESDKSYDLSFTITKQDNGLNSNVCTKHESSSTEPKDKIQIVDGVARNFNFENYIEIINLNGTYGAVIAVKTDDDPSKDQAIFGYANGPSIMIKDSILSYCSESGKITNAYMEQIMDDGSTGLAPYEIWDEQTYYFALVKKQEIDDLYESYDEINGYVDIYISEDMKEWDKVFTNIQFPIKDELLLGYGKTDTGILPWNGYIDLTKSYVQRLDRTEQIPGSGIVNIVKPERLYNFTATTQVKMDDTIIKTIVTPYMVDEFTFGYRFTGTLDLYNSQGGLLLNYDLCWLEDRQDINKVIRKMLQEADPDYDVDEDTKFYTPEAYGIQLDKQPKRWDEIQIVYTTVDHAFYMLPNTKYYLTCDVVDDKESGKSQVHPVNNAKWINGVVSDFKNGYYTYNITNEECIVLNLTTKDVTTRQALCGYTDAISQSIMIEDSMLKYFDGINYHNIIEIQNNQNIYIKLYNNLNFIEYSLDNENWNVTEIEATFNGYDTFQIGLASVGTEQKPFLGSIDLNKSYVIKNEDVIFLFKHYRKIMPYISQDKINWTPLTLVPLLTIYDYVSFGTGFDGSLDLFASNLLLKDTIYWVAKHIDIYYKENDVLAETIIRDSVSIDEDVYYTKEYEQKVDLRFLDIVVTGLPIIGDIITLTYNCWYMFRKLNTKYQFNVIYENNRIYISFNELDGPKQLLYVTEARDLVIKSGIEFDGSINLAESTRGGMTFAEILEWDSYNVLFKKHEEKEWTYWTKFTLKRGTISYMRTGYDLDGWLQMDTSYVETEDFHTPFISYYNSKYITPVGNVDITNGVASNFDEGYISLNKNMVTDGCMVEVVYKQYDDISNQGMSTNLMIGGGNIIYVNKPTIPLHKAHEDYQYTVRYFYENGKIRMSVIGSNYSQFNPRRSKRRVVNIIPFNTKVFETQEGYYITSQEVADKVHLSYRLYKDDDSYDPYTLTGGVWHDVPLEKQPVSYFLQDLGEIFIGTIELGYTIKNNIYVNCNKHKVPYYNGDIIQYRIIIGDKQNPSYVAHNWFIAYNDLTMKQEIQV